MKSEKIKYIVNRNYNTSRTGAEALVKMIKQINKVECIQYNIDDNKNLCYTEISSRDSCVIPNCSEEE